MFIQVEVAGTDIALKMSNIRKVKKTEKGCQIFFMRKNDSPLKTDTPFTDVKLDLDGFIRFDTSKGGQFLIRKSLIRKVTASDTGCLLTISHPKEGILRTIYSYQSIYFQLTLK